jgi:hypothetical protein
MSALSLRLSSRGLVAEGHPAVNRRRRRELALISASVAIPLAVALAVSVQVSDPNFLLTFGLIAGGLCVTALFASPRLQVTVAIIALYLGLLEGPVKLGSGGHASASVVRDVLIFAVCLGALMRLLAKREQIRLPPLSAWALAYAAVVLVEAFNPSTHGILKTLGGFRQQLEFIPFFFFGYAIMRSKQRFRRLFLILGVLALANGVVSVYQTRLSPGQLAAWGPGYHELVFGEHGLSARTYAGGGATHVRPPGLGTDSGDGASFGLVALPAALALLATGSLRRRWPVLLLCFGALAGVATGLGREQVVTAVIAVVAFVLLSFTSGRRVTKPLAALLGIVVLALPLGAVFVSFEGSGTFSRYTEIAPENIGEAKDTKLGEVEHIPHQALVAPFGVGLGTAGAASGFGGKVSEVLEGHGTGAESQYKFVLDELGIPGLLLWLGLVIRVLTLALPGMRRIGDYELRLYLAAVVAPLIAMAISGVSGAVMSSAALGPFYWFAAGVVAYWFAGPGRSLAMRREVGEGELAIAR